MKRTTRILALATTLLVITASAALFAGKQDFVLANKTGLTIAEVYVSASDTDNWEEDVLGQDVLEDEQSVKIRFATGATQCTFDLKIVDEDGDDLFWTDIDLCKASRVTLKPKGKAEIE